MCEGLGWWVSIREGGGSCRVRRREDWEACRGGCGRVAGADGVLHTVADIDDLEVSGVLTVGTESFLSEHAKGCSRSQVTI